MDGRYNISFSYVFTVYNANFDKIYFDVERRTSA